MIELIRGLHNIRALHQGCVATLGNFDGVHQGHLEIIEQVKQQAKKLQLPSLVMLFEPQPLEFFQPEQAPARLTHFAEKVRLLRNLNIDRILCVKFNAALSQLSAQDFVKDLLVDKLAVRHLVVGDDFRFGRQRQGDYDFLVAAGKQYGFQVERSHSIVWQGERISSTRIRNCLAENNFTAVKALLGRPYTLSGRVVRGDALARTLGTPTANILLKHKQPPLSGVFVVKVRIDSELPLFTKEGVGGSSLGFLTPPLSPSLAKRGNIYFGVANIGKRPTVQGTQLRLETHLLDFNGDLYGRRLTVEFLHKLRGEQKFSGLPALKEAIQKDIANARIFLTSYFSIPHCLDDQ